MSRDQRENILFFLVNRWKTMTVTGANEQEF